MVKRGFRLVKMSKFLLKKQRKFSNVFVISLGRIFLEIIKKITIQHNITRTNSMVDYFIEIKEINMYLFFKIIANTLLLNYNQLITLTCIDNLNLPNFKLKKRFSLVYVLNQINTTSRILIIVDFSPKVIISSISSIYKNVNWLEREVYDLFGIFFFKNKDLRRILTDYGFQGFPLRKDFPLTGYLELKYNEMKKNVRYQKLLLMQEYRQFFYNCPWVQYGAINIIEQK